MTYSARNKWVVGGAAEGELVWIVQRGDGGPLSVILERLGSGVRVAIGEGRVFVDGIRVHDLGYNVREGARIEIRKRRTVGVGCSIIDRRGDLIAAYKPAGISSEPDRLGGESLVAQIARLAGCAPGALHAASRLDRDVSGVVLLAASSAACVHLERSRHGRAFRKFYVAIGAGAPAPAQGTWNTPLRGKGASQELQSACTRYRVRATAGAVAPGGAPSVGTAVGASLLELEAVTGRFHQLRRHCAAAGFPLFGDAKYAGERRIVRPSGSVMALRRVALHAACIAVPDMAGAFWITVSPFPSEFPEVWCACGGQAGELDAMDGDGYWRRSWLAR